MESKKVMILTSRLTNNVNGSNVASFFGNEKPEFIGFVGCLSAYSNEVLGSVFKDPKFFSNLPLLEKMRSIASDRSIMKRW